MGSVVRSRQPDLGMRDRCVTSGPVGFPLCECAPSFSLGMTAYFAILLAGLATMGWAQSRARAGIRKEIWSDAQVEPLRRLLKRRSTVAFVLLPAGVLAVLCLLRRDGSSVSFLLPLTITVAQPLSMLRNELAPTPRAGLLDWGGLQPLRSEHWGAPGPAGETASH
jgi:hypothetical protein